MTELFQAHWRTVVGFLARRTGDPLLAEELAQETFTRATAAFLGRRDGSPAAWLLAIARNVLIDHHRRGRKLVSIDAAELLADQGHGIEDVEVRDLLARLPDTSRRLLQLVYLDGFSQAEIAAMTGRNPAAVRTAVWRARDALRALLTEEDPADDRR